MKRFRAFIVALKKELVKKSALETRAADQPKHRLKLRACVCFENDLF